MVSYHPSNSRVNPDGHGQTLASKDTLIIDAGLYLIGGYGYGVYCQGGNIVTCNGVIGGTSKGIQSFSSSINVGASGTVSGQDEGIAAFFSTSITNKGQIFGGVIGVELYDTASLVNYGTISAGTSNAGFNAAVYLGNEHRSTTIKNFGILEAKNAGQYAVGSYNMVSNDTLINNGTIKGHVVLSGGNDTYDGLKGKISRGTIDGGAGQDKITGGVGAETTSGGAGSDTFYFRAKLGAVDHITDFSRTQDKIALDDAIFKGVKTSLLSSQFHDIANQPTQSDDRILYNHDSGALYYDADGRGGVKPVLVAVLDNHEPITFRDFLVV